MANQLDDLNPRDPKQLNNYALSCYNTHYQRLTNLSGMTPAWVQNIEFDDVIGEPASLLSLDGVWEKSARTFNLSKDICYMLLSTIFGLPIALLCGLKFACLSFSSIWCGTPCTKAFHLCIGATKGAYGTFIRCLLDPFCESFGKFFGNIRVSKTDV